MKADNSHALLSEADQLGLEARVVHNDHATLKLWLRLLACTTQIESEIRRRLRQRFGISLSRFDYMAQLYRQPEGLRMKDLSRHLMVTGGNVTGLTDELEREGMVAREGSPTDRRAWIVRLTDTGRTAFSAMATEHEQWLVALFAGFGGDDAQKLYRQLGQLRVQLMAPTEAAEDPTPKPARSTRVV